MTVNNAGLKKGNPSTTNSLPLFYNYSYDQLNRIVGMQAYKGLNEATNVWTPISIQDYAEATTYDPDGNILTYGRNGAPEVGMPQKMDDLSYEYYAGNNRLKRVGDNSSLTGNYAEDIDNQTDPNNYTYDAIGNLKTDVSEGITAINWTVYGKIASVVKSSGTISYAYDASGNRITKTAAGKTTLYIRDAGGNVMSVYEVPALNQIEQKELHLYGSSRLGMALKESRATVTDALATGFDPAKTRTQRRGEKFFELSNHLGNVLTTLTDKKLQQGKAAPNESELDYFTVDVASATDYYPFGMSMPGRKVASEGYRYGFNGKENDPETGTQDYGFRIYNPALGKFLSVDPLTRSYSYYSPYHFAGNMPIAAVDLDGLEVSVAFKGAALWKDKANIDIATEVTIKIQIINLSATPDSKISTAIPQYLTSDLESKLSGDVTLPLSMSIRFVPDEKAGWVKGELTGGEQRQYFLNFSTKVRASVQTITKVEQISPDALVFAIVDEVNDKSNFANIGRAQMNGKIAIGEAKYFDGSKSFKEARGLILHEVLHLFGLSDTYPEENKHPLPGTNNKDNVMYSSSSDSKLLLTNDQLAKEFIPSTIVTTFTNLLLPGPYKQPSRSESKHSREALKEFIEKNGYAEKLEK